MTRTQTRELAFELIYSLEIQKISLSEYEEQINLFLNNKEIKIQKVEKYIKETINGINENKEEILKLISQNLNEKWHIKRISKVNLALLKLAVYEIVYTKVPYKVVINEVVEIAKKYGDNNSSFFVNGILANIIKQLGIKDEEQ